MMLLAEVENVSFHRNEQRQFFNGLDFFLQSHEKIGITGDNGAGKSSFLHMLMGLTKPLSGSIKILGETCVSDRDFVNARKRLGLLFQNADDQLFCPTVIDDVAFGPLNLGFDQKTAIAKAQLALDKVGKRDLEHRICHSLSGGEKRMVALACVLAMEPEGLLLDEPTNALDHASRHHLIDVLNQLDIGILVISHDMPFLKTVVQRNVELKQGKFYEC